MKYTLVKSNELDETFILYRNVIETTKTWDWNEQYPSKDMVKDDIENGNLEFEQEIEHFEESSLDKQITF